MVGLDSTKVAFFQSFRELSLKEDIEAISVSDIVDLSHISKATFYRHFSDKYEVMNFLHTERIKNNNPFTKRFTDGLIGFLSFILRNKAYYESISRYKGQNCFSDSLKELFKQSFLKFLSVKENEPQNTEIYFLVCFYCNGCADELIKWIENDCDTSAEEFAKLLRLALPKELEERFD